MHIRWDDISCCNKLTHNFSGFTWSTFPSCPVTAECGSPGQQASCFSLRCDRGVQAPPFCGRVILKGHQTPCPPRRGPGSEGTHPTASQFLLSRTSHVTWMPRVLGVWSPARGHLLVTDRSIIIEEPQLK